MIKLGSTDITNVMLGTTKVDAIFLGNTKVYPSLPVVEGVYVYHVDKKFYTFLEFQKLSNTNISQVLGFAIVDSNGSFLLPPRPNLTNGYRWCPENFDTFIVPDVGIGVDDLNGRQNTETLHNTFHNVAGSNEYAAGYAYRFTPVPIGTSWYLPSIGELIIIHMYMSELNDWVFDTFGFSYFGYKALWSSTQQDATTAWQLDISGGAYNTTAKRTLNAALPVIKLG